MKKKIAAAMLAVFAFGAVSVLAHAGEEEATIPLSATGQAADVYVDADGPGVWQESNGLAGLQTHPTVVDGVTIPPDSQVL